MGSQPNMSYTREQNFVRAQSKPLKPKPQTQQGPFDPEELSRRLYVVLADQKARSERKSVKTEDAKLKDARSWTRRHLGKEASVGKPKETALETAAPAQSSSKRTTSLKPTGSTSSTELKKQKSPTLITQRKESKANPAKEAPKPAPEPVATYHHVPQEAAKQFARTTSIPAMRDNGSNNQAHQLSKQALKLHLAAGAGAHSSSLRAAATEETATSPVERLLKDRGRVDEWRTRIPEDVPEADEDRAEYHTAPQHHAQPQPHTFQAELARLTTPPSHDAEQNRRNSTGDLFDRPGGDTRLSMVLVVGHASLADVLEDATPPPDPAAADEHRVDWTQSDERPAAAAAPRTHSAPLLAQRHKPLLSPLLRKADSKWTLRGRLGSGGRGSAAAAAQEKGESPASPTSPRSPTKEKSGFFAKFKR